MSVAASDPRVRRLPLPASTESRLEDADEEMMARHGWVRTTSHVGRLRQALRSMLALYLDVAYSGIIPSRDPEIEAEVQRARLALADRGCEELVGWVRYDGDEYHDFRYASPTDRQHIDRITRAGYLPVYCRRLPE